MELAPTLIPWFLAIAKVESSFKPNASGDDDKAYGLFQFHHDRWLECGGTDDNWKKASIETQCRVMKTQYERAKTENIVEFLNYHNLGHKSKEITKYVRKIYREREKK